MAAGLIRILVVDDSALYRQLVLNVLREFANVEVVGTAANGREALERISELAPDLVTLDVRMPQVDGIDVLRELKRRRSRTKAIMLSSLTLNGAQVTTDALLEGAFDFILKPAGPDAHANRQALAEALEEKIGAFRDSRRAPASADRAARQTEKPESPIRADVRRTTADPSDRPGTAYAAILIATSTGGPVALREVLPCLPGDLPVPILIVQHMPPQYTHSLAERINEASELEVVEACDGMTLEPGWAFIAPGGRQMKIAPRGSRPVIRITDDPPEHGCRPSADYLFRSAAEVFGGNVMVAVLTGMGRDGTEGCRELKRKGALVIAQDPAGCIVYGMPKAVIEERLADKIVPLDQLASVFVDLLRK